jgi:hypothetical protein
MKGTQLNAKLLATALLAFMSSPAWGTGDTYTRVAEIARVGAAGVVPNCTGQLFESLSEYGNVHGGGDFLSLICATSPKTAAWVLISGTDCYDDSDSQDSKCSKTRPVPQFNIRSDWYEDKRPPYGMQYQMVKYALGRGCQAISQHYSSTNKDSSEGQENRWVCERLDIFDGAQDSSGHHIDDSKPLRIIIAETSSSRPLVSSGSQNSTTTEFPQEFLIPTALYVYSPLRD